MKFGPLAPNKLPDQDPQKVLLHAERWQRALFAQETWATPAKECYDFLEGRHYTAAELAKLKSERRPHYKFNIIAPLLRLIIGYQGNNRTDITHKPGQDTRSTESSAEALSKLEKAASEISMLDFVDAEVFLDGLAGGRGWYETYLDFEHNDLGELRTARANPFTVYPDPDADTYDLNESSSHIIKSKMVSIDEIESTMGKKVAELLRPWTNGQTPISPISGVAIVNDEVSPQRYFGRREDDSSSYWDTFYGLMGSFTDQYRKTIRILECQHKVREPRNVIIDLETGDTEVLPENWDQQRIQKALLWGEMKNNPMRVEKRMVQRIQHTTISGDITLYDQPSFYDTFTLTGYFPYFRDGITRGMVEDLVDPQKEKNKERNARIETQAKSANGGWKYHESSLDPKEAANLKKFGSSPGFHLKWKGDHAPELIQPVSPPISYEKLERQSDADVHQISGLNESALGEVDSAGASGRATLARQRQAVVGVQMYISNLRRSKMLVGRKHLYIFQNYYTEQRIYRITGDDGKQEQVTINQLLADPISGAKQIINDITLGKYQTVVDEQPLSATFANAQFEEMMQLLEKMPFLQQVAPQFADLIIGMSSMPRKDEWIKRLQELAQPHDQGPAPPKVSESINFKDLPPEGKVQLAAKAGINLSHASAMAPPAPTAGHASAPSGVPAHAPSQSHPSAGPGGVRGNNPHLTPAEAALPGGMH